MATPRKNLIGGKNIGVGYFRGWAFKFRHFCGFVGDPQGLIWDTNGPMSEKRILFLAKVVCRTFLDKPVMGAYLTLWVLDGGSAMPDFEGAHLKVQFPTFLDWPAWGGGGFV